MKIPLPVTAFDLACHGPRRLEKVDGKWSLMVQDWVLRDLEEHEVLFVEAALATAATPASAVPDEWKLVPVKPTKEMLISGWAEASGHTVVANVWSSMLYAAPEAPRG